MGPKKIWKQNAGHQVETVGSVPLIQHPKINKETATVENTNPEMSCMLSCTSSRSTIAVGSCSPKHVMKKTQLTHKKGVTYVIIIRPGSLSLFFGTITHPGSLCYAMRAPYVFY